MRRPRSLHICNLANVAYGYCKILRQAGHELALRCHDLKHVMSQPEWDDLELRGEDFRDEWDFTNNTANFGGYTRPSWYDPEGIQPRHYSPLPDPDEDGPARPSRLGHRLRGALASRSTRPGPGRRARSGLSEARFEHLIEESRKNGAKFAIDRDMLNAYHPHAWWARDHSREFDVVFSYVMAPIYTLLLGDRPWVSIEIGTMRDIPFDDSADGRLLALAYRLSPHVLITNPDVVEQARQLGVASYAFCPHPLDEDLYVPEPDSEFRRSLLAQSGADVILFAPARQNWEVKRNDRYLKAFRALVQDDGVKAYLIIPGWGQEVDRSKRYCRELGIERWVSWIPPQSEALLMKYYRAADFILDQFDLGVFGLTTPKAMSCGAVVVTSYDPGPHEWCFQEHPPLVAARKTGEIRRELVDLCRNPERRRQISAAARRWVLQHHSKRVIRSILQEAAVIASERHRAMA